MKLINFLETLEQKKVKRNLKPQLIKDNFYYINGVSFREMNNLVKKYQNKYKLIDVSKLIDNDILYKSDIIKINHLIISKRGLLDLNTNRNYLSKKETGLMFLEKINQENKKVNTIEKKYKTFDDLVNNPNIGILRQKVSGVSAYICYDKELIIKDEEEFNMNSILFAFSFYKNEVYDANMVLSVSSSPHVNGKYFIYSMIGSLSKNNLLYAYHKDAQLQHVLSPGARRVWLDFYNNKKMFKPFIPLDDIENPVTDDKKDDSEVFNKVSKENMEFWLKTKESDKIKYSQFKNQQDFLKKFKKGDFPDWIYKLYDSGIISKARSTLLVLIKRHNSSTQEEKKIIMNKINENGDRYFIEMKNIREKMSN